MKILLFGKTGLLGHALFDALSGEHEVLAPEHRACDVTDEKSLEKIFKNTKPDVVINATGYTSVDKAETDRQTAFALNHLAVANFARILKPTEIPFVHFSTDYVFDGMNSTGYDENASPAPLSTYGASKAAGEMEIIKNLKKYYLIRTSWLYGPHGKNFVDAMLACAEKGEPIKVVQDQIGNPTYSPDLAQAVSAVLKGTPYGIYHIVNEGDTSWYDFAVEIFQELGVPITITPVTTKELNRKAARPRYSMLRNTKLQKLRHWKKALEDYLVNKTLII